MTLYAYGIEVNEEDDEKHVSEILTNCFKFILPPKALVSIKKDYTFFKTAAR